MTSLLAMNRGTLLAHSARGLLRFAWTFLCLGLWFILRSWCISMPNTLRSVNCFTRGSEWPCGCGCLPAGGVLASLVCRSLFLRSGFDFERPTHFLGMRSTVVGRRPGGGCVLAEAFFQVAPDQAQKSFHKTTSEYCRILLYSLVMVFLERIWDRNRGQSLPSCFSWLFPLGCSLERERFNFLQIGRQRNLIYAVFLVFLALLYLSFVRRAGLCGSITCLPKLRSAPAFLPVVFLSRCSG